MGNPYAAIFVFIIWTLFIGVFCWEARSWYDGEKTAKAIAQRLDNFEAGQQKIIQSSDAITKIRKNNPNPCILPSAGIKLLQSATR